MQNQGQNKGRIIPIDSLKGIAIAGVILYHLLPSLAPSGYAGVDIFFVVSGYFFASSMQKQRLYDFRLQSVIRIALGKQSRIYSSLLVYVLLIGLTVIRLNHSPGGILGTGISSLFGISNIYLIFTSDNYFSSSPILNPFLNTWYLGAYLQITVIIALLYFLCKSKQANKKTHDSRIMQCAFIASFAYFISLYSSDNISIAYYSSFSRAWEMIGGFLCFEYKISNVDTAPNRYLPRKLIENSCNIVPLIILLLYSIPGMPIGFVNVTTCFLSSFLLYSLQAIPVPQLSSSKILENRLLAFLGTISFSLFLWHWGIFSILSWFIESKSQIVFFTILLSLVISVLNYNFIEKLNLSNFLKNYFALVWVLSATGISLLLLFLRNLDLTGYKQQVRKPFVPSSTISRSNCMPADRSVTESDLFRCLHSRQDSQNVSKTLWFLGDSHNESMSGAANYLFEKSHSNIFMFSQPGTIYPPFSSTACLSNRSKVSSKLKENNLHQAYNFVLRQSKPGDVLFLTYRYQLYITNKLRRSDCEHNNNAPYDNLLINQDFVNWLQKMKAFLHDLDHKNINVVIVLPTPEFSIAQICSSPVAINKHSACSVQRTDVQSVFPKDVFYKFRSYNNLLNISLFDPVDSLCGEKSCKYIKDGRLLYRDVSHLTNHSSSTLLGPSLLELISAK